MIGQIAKSQLKRYLSDKNKLQIILGRSNIKAISIAVVGLKKTIINVVEVLT